jgi:hypothetical protein
MIVNITTFTLIHTLISLVAIVSGLVVVGGLMARTRLEGWTGLFLATTALTSITGFGFPSTRLLPSQDIGIISLVVLVPMIFALYRKHLEGAWRGVYVGGSVLILYLNVFVLMDQLFKRIPALIVLAPTHKEPPYVVTQLLVLALFGVLGMAAFRRLRPQPVAAERAVRVPVAVPNR